MSLIKSLFKETALYSIGSFGSKILSFVLIFFYSYFLSKAELGKYDLFITMSMFFVPIALLQISDAVYRWLISIETDQVIEKKRVLTSGFYIVFGINFLLNIFFYFIFQFKEIPYSEYFGVYLLFSSLLILLQSVLRGFKMVKLYSFYGIITTLLLVLFNIVFIYVLEYNVKGAILAGVIANLVSVLLISIHIKVYKYISFSSFDIQLSKKMLAYSLPLIPNLISWWLISSASKFIIEYKMGVEANGIYAISNRLPSILIVINSVIILPIQDYYLKKDGDFEKFCLILKNFMYFEVILAFLLSLGAPIYTKYIVNSSFYESWIYVAPLFLGVAFNTVATLISLIYQKEKKTIRITITTMIGGFISVLMSYFLIDYIGLFGISISFMMGYFLVLILRYIDINNKYRLDLGFPAFMLLIICCIVALTIQYNLTFLRQLFFLLFNIVIILFFMRRKIFVLIELLKKDK